MFEGWKDVPLAVRRRLADWDVDFYAERIREDVEAVRAGRPGESYEARYSYVLLSEAEAIVAAQDHIYLWPCDCRSIVGKCRKAMDVCLRFGNDRGLGWEISRERAVAILRTTDKAGLMHTADLQDDAAATSSICNCCTDCCYPHLAATRLEASDVWPVRRRVARIAEDLCKACGRCGLRCPFEAIVCDTAGRPAFEAALCRGCGLCATGCSADAIELLPLDAG
jgi:Pyruvate/2-oxoacid:ferredoxin oxidoreductase delta subunit